MIDLEFDCVVLFIKLISHIHKMAILSKKSLFWDASEINEERNKKFIIERILNYGNENDFHNTLERYGKKEISEVVLNSRVLDKKSLSFWCQYFHLDLNKCLSNQSATRQSLFWKR